MIDYTTEQPFIELSDKISSEYLQLKYEFSLPTTKIQFRLSERLDMSVDPIVIDESNLIVVNSYAIDANNNNYYNQKVDFGILYITKYYSNEVPASIPKPIVMTGTHSDNCIKSNTNYFLQIRGLCGIDKNGGEIWTNWSEIAHGATAA